MAKVEIEESELQKLVTAAQANEANVRASKLLAQLSGKPESRMLLEKSIKIHHPEIETEEDIVARHREPILKEVKELVEKFDGFRKEVEERETKRTEERSATETQTALNRVRESMGLTDEGVEKVKALMTTRNIPDPEAAAALFLRNETPVVASSAYEPAAWQMPGAPTAESEVKELLSDPDRWADKTAGAVLADMRKAAA